MTARVWMAHPDLPDQLIHVPESAAPHHASAGWTVAEPPPAPPLPDPDEPPVGEEPMTGAETADAVPGDDHQANEPDSAEPADDETAAADDPTDPAAPKRRRGSTPKE